MKVHFLLLLLFTIAFCTPLGAKSHTVTKSETFYSISRQYGVSVNALMAANDITDPTKLNLGQKITIPEKSSSTKAANNKSVSLKSDSAPIVKAVNKSTTIIIDPGHGGRDRGASRSGTDEADLTLQVALRLEKQLKNSGYRVVLTRRSNTYVSLGTRATTANKYRDALFVSIHFNAVHGVHSGIRGTEVYYASTSGRSLAKNIQPLIAKASDTRNRGIRMARYSVLMNTHCPAVLIECGYLSHNSERKNCTTAGFQEKIAAAISSGIQQFDRSN